MNTAVRFKKKKTERHVWFIGFVKVWQQQFYQCCRWVLFNAVGALKYVVFVVGPLRFSSSKKVQSLEVLRTSSIMAFELSGFNEFIQPVTCNGFFVDRLREREYQGQAILNSAKSRFRVTLVLYLV